MLLTSPAGMHSFDWLLTWSDNAIADFSIDMALLILVGDLGSATASDIFLAVPVAMALRCVSW